MSERVKAEPAAATADLFASYKIKQEPAMSPEPPKFSDCTDDASADTDNAIKEEQTATIQEMVSVKIEPVAEPELITIKVEISLPDQESVSGEGPDKSPGDMNEIKSCPVKVECVLGGNEEPSTSNCEESTPNTVQPETHADNNFLLPYSSLQGGWQGMSERVQAEPAAATADLFASYEIKQEPAMSPEPPKFSDSTDDASADKDNAIKEEQTATIQDMVSVKIEPVAEPELITIKVENLPTDQESANREMCEIKSCPVKVECVLVGNEEPSTSNCEESTPNTVQTETHADNYWCDICKKSLYSNKYLIQHKLTHRVEIKKVHTCEICNKQFADGSNLKRHSRDHTGAKPFTCEICDRKFAFAYEFKRHKLSHTGEKPYTCDVCKKQFSSVSKLNEHKRIHNGDKSFACETCNKQFTQSSYLVVHRRSHTGEKPFTCEVCQKQFSRMSNLKQHVKSHTGEKPFGCEYCRKKFKLKADVQHHTRSHLGERPYACHVCKKRFIDSSTLKKHERCHTG